MAYGALAAVVEGSPTRAAVVGRAVVTAWVGAEKDSAVAAAAGEAVK
jgi:hypothetical protein